MDEIETTRQYCLENCILSGSNPRVITATLEYLRMFKTIDHRKQGDICCEYNVSTVALRNNMHKITRSKHLLTIKKLLGNPNIGLRC